MESLIQLKKAILLSIIPLTLASVAVTPMARAVTPAPDGGYPGGNTAEGQAALRSLTTGTYNTASGFLSLRSNTMGKFNTATGAGTLLANTGDQNTATGVGALLTNTAGFENTANGAFALFSNTTANFNTAVGAGALLNSTGISNTAIGASALLNNTTGSNNTALGQSAGISVTTANNIICIGPVPGANVDSTCFIGYIRGTTTQNNDAIPVLVDSANQLGTASSSRRFKTDIKPMDKASEAILAFKPVSFRYKVHKDATRQFGLIAEDVAEVNPDLVVRDKNGDIYTVRYDAVNAMLLNEFLKEHRAFIEEQRKVEKLEATVAQQHKDFEAALVDLKGQIQKVSAQLELNKSEPQTVMNNR